MNGSFLVPISRDGCGSGEFFGFGSADGLFPEIPDIFGGGSDILCSQFAGGFIFRGSFFYTAFEVGINFVRFKSEFSIFFGNIGFVRSPGVSGFFGSSGSSDEQATAEVARHAMHNNNDEKTEYFFIVKDFG